MSELSPKERLVLTLRHGVSDNIPRSISEIAELPSSRPAPVAGAGAAGLDRLVCQRAAARSASELAELLLYTNPNCEGLVRNWVALE